MGSTVDSGDLPKNLEPLFVLNHKAAADVLLGCVKDAGALNQDMRIALEENSGGEFLLRFMLTLSLSLVLISVSLGQHGYSEILQKKSDTK